MALQFILVGKGDGMDQKIKLTPALINGGKHCIHGRRVSNVTRNHEIGTGGFGQRLNPFFQGISLVGQGQLRPLPMNGFGDSPGDGSIVGNTHYQALLACHQLPGVGHESPLVIIFAPFGARPTRD